MSTDLRALLQSLAEDAPALDNRIALADRSYAAGRRRRRVRHLETSGATAIVVLCALFASLFLGSAPLAARYGTSSASHVSGYPKEIGRQFPVLDLPAKAGPIAGVISNGSTAWAVSPNGHRWLIPGDHGGIDYPTAVSRDGRLIAFLAGDQGPLLIHDLVTGVVTRVAGIGANPDEGRQRFGLIVQSAPAHFSSDDRYLAFSAYDGNLSGSASGTVVVDVRAASIVSSSPSTGHVTGWSGETVVTSAQTVQRASLTGKVVGAATMHPTEPLGAGAGNGAGAGVSGDGQQWLFLSGGDSIARVTRFDLATGAQIDRSPPVAPVTDLCGFAASDKVVYTQRDGTSVVTVDADGGAVAATSIAPVLKIDCGVWASDAFDGRPHGRLLLDRLTGWLTIWWARLAGFAGGLVVALLRGRWLRGRLRRRRQLRDLQHPQFARQPWSRRRRAVTATAAVTPVLVLLGLLIPNVVLASEARLTTTQTPLLWSPTDQAKAALSGVDGATALTISARRGVVQGWAVLVENHSDQDIHLLGSPDSDGMDAQGNGVGVATSAGNAAQARNLTYRASGVIPAHGARWIRDLGAQCVKASDPSVAANLIGSAGGYTGGYSAEGGLDLRIRVGWTTRTVTLSISPKIEWIASGNC